MLIFRRKVLTFVEQSYKIYLCEMPDKAHTAVMGKACRTGTGKADRAWPVLVMGWTVPPLGRTAATKISGGESPLRGEIMKLYSISDPAFAAYGKVLEGYDTDALRKTLEQVTPVPDGVDYVPAQPELEALPIARLLSDNAYGGMPIQLGWCNGHNTKLNCLEYHRDSELNCGTTDFVLLLAKMDDLENGRLDTGKVKAFFVPAGVLVEVYATTLHYAPCSAHKGEGFRVLVALPKGTNGPKPAITPLNQEDETLWACNKWLLAHAESTEAAQGAPVLLDGINIDIAADI